MSDDEDDNGSGLQATLNKFFGVGKRKAAEIEPPIQAIKNSQEDDDLSDDDPIYTYTEEENDWDDRSSVDEPTLLRDGYEFINLAIYSKKMKTWGTEKVSRQIVYVPENMEDGRPWQITNEDTLLQLRMQYEQEDKNKSVYRGNINRERHFQSNKRGFFEYCGCFRANCSKNAAASNHWCHTCCRRYGCCLIVTINLLSLLIL